MNSILKETFLLNTISQWLIAIAFIVGGILVAKIAYYILKKSLGTYTNKTKTKLDNLIVKTLEKPAVFTITLFGFHLAMNQLNKTPYIEAIISKGYEFLIVVCITWFAVKIINALVDEYMLPIVLKTESDFDNQVLPILKQIIAAGVWVIGAIIAFDTIGYNLAGLIAGLGIGGLAFALAAKDYIQNIFGGVSIFTDRPFKINDRVRIDGFDGKIEEIGIRSSRIRTLSGSLVTIPNSKFISNSVENVALEPNRKINIKLGLTYDTDASGVEKGMNILKEIVNNNQDAITEEPVIYFESFGDFSLNINFIYYIRKGADIPTTQSIVNLAILTQFEAAGLDFAFPTQTLYNINTNQ